MADKTIKVKVEADTEEAEGKFVKLQTRIRETKIALQQAVEAGDTKSINNLRGELDDLQDQFDKTTIQSKKFADSLASVPGPAGMVGKAIKGVDDAFKFMLANPVVAILAAIAAALLGMYKALQQSKEGMAVLNKVTDAFGNIIQAVVGVVTKIAMPIFEAFAKLMSFVSAAFADASGNYKQYQEELANDEGARIAEANAERIKKLLDSEGFKYDEITKKKIAATQLMNEKIKKINDSTDSLEEKRRLKELARQEQNKSIADGDIQRAKIVSDANKAASDKATAAAEKAFNAKIARMSSEDKLDEAKLEKLKQEELAKATTEQAKAAIEELYSRKKYEQAKINIQQLQSEYAKDSKEYMDYQAQLISLDANRTKEVVDESDKRKKAREQENKDLQDYLNLQEDIRIAAIKDETIREDEQFVAKRGREKIAITANESFIKEKATRQAEILKEFDDATDVQEAERADKRKAKAIDDQLRLLELKGQALTEGTRAFYENQEAMLRAAADKEILAAKGNADTILAIKAKLNQDLDDLNEKRIASDYAVATATLDALSSLSGALAGSLDEEAKTSKKAFEQRKKLQKATAIMSAASGIITILTQPSTLPSPFDFIVKGINAAALAISTAVNIKKIDQTQFESAGSSSSAAAPPTPTFSAPQQAQVPNIGASVVSSEGRIGQIVNSAATQQGNRPLQTYVIGNQVSSQQQLDRRVSLAAKMGG